MTFETACFSYAVNFFFASLSWLALGHFLNSNESCYLFFSQVTSLNLSYSDNGLFGMYLVCDGSNTGAVSILFINYGTFSVDVYEALECF